MEHVFNIHYTVKGQEVLHFPEAQVDKVKDTAKSFSSFGGLSIIYYPDYHRYVLQINDWKYPLVRRLPIIAYDKTSLHSRTYLLPSANGFAYLLKLTSIPNLQALANFESILTNNSNFTYRGEASTKKLEHSPDDKLYRHKPSDTGIMEKVSETIKSGFEKIKIKKESFNMGTKNLTSRKKMIHLKDIKNKKFRKSAHTTFKKDFFETHEKSAFHFMRMRRENINMTEARQFSDLTKGDLPNLYTPRDDLENTILNYKELAASGKVNLVISEPSLPSKESLITGRDIPVLREAPGKTEANKLPTMEGMAPYSG